MASSLRLRILRLCNDREWTKKELADRLERDPSTILYHLRLLGAAGLLEPVGVRQSAGGAYEKPYRSTGLFVAPQVRPGSRDEREADNAMLAAFRQELAESGRESIYEPTRFHLHLEDAARDSFVERAPSLIEESRVHDADRNHHGASGYGDILVLHRLPTDNRAAP